MLPSQVGTMIERRLQISLMMLSIVLCCMKAAKAQEYTFAYVQNENGAVSSASVTSLKYTIAKKVFDALVIARGDLRLPSPDFASKCSNFRNI